MDIREFLERYVFVRKCVCCGELLSYDERNEAFCSECSKGFDTAKIDFCSKCERSMIECQCMVGSLSRVGLLTLRKLTAYDTLKHNAPARKMVLYLKNNRNKRVTAFVATQLSYRVEEIMKEASLCPNDVVISIVPRSRKAISLHGFDQSELVAQKLAEILKIEFLPLIKRSKKKAKNQKTLKAEQRKQNARGMFEANDEAFDLLGERSVILFDDVVTSGASMAEAIRVMRKKKVKAIFGLCISVAKRKQV